MLRFAITATSNAHAARLADDLGRYLGDALGQTCVVEVCSSFAEIADELLEGRSSLGWLPPFAYVRISRVSRVQLLLRAVRAEQSSYFSVVFALADSSIEGVQDLVGRRIAFVDTMSAAGYLFPLAGLAAAGVPERSLGAVSFEGSHTKVVQAVVGRRADAGATFCTWLGSETTSPVHSAGWTEGGLLTPPPVKVIERFGPIPGDTICASADLRRSEREAISQALAHMHETQAGAILARGVFGASRFEPAIPAHYEAVADAARIVGLD